MRRIVTLAALMPMLAGWVINPGTTAHLRWVQSQGPVAAYEVEIDGEIIDTVPGPSFVWEDCVPRTDHVVTVRAVDVDGHRGPKSPPSKPFRCLDVQPGWNADANGDGVVEGLVDFAPFGAAQGGETIEGPYSP